MPRSDASSAVLTVIRLGKVLEIVLADAGLTVNQYRMLTFAESGAPSLREMSARLAMKPPNVSVLVDGLAARGLVGRRRHPEDGRRFELVLTGRGARVLKQARAGCEAALSHLAAAPGAPNDLLRSLNGWTTALDDAASDLRHSLEIAATGVNEVRIASRSRSRSRRRMTSTASD
jgi:DNA-binding MarR family transcriptional regulator